MSTTAEERAWLSQNWTVGEPEFRTWLAGSDHAHSLVPRLIADIERLEADNEKLRKALEKALPDLEWLDTGGEQIDDDGALHVIADEDRPLLAAREALKGDQ